MMGPGGITGGGGIEPPLSSSKIGETKGPAGAAGGQGPKGPVKMDLKEYFIELMGEEKGTQAYNQFLMTAFVLPSIQQQQQAQQRIKEAEEQMMG